MAAAEKKLRICSKGHRFYKSSDCPTCPFCEKERKPTSGFLSELGAPARRALENKGITTLEKLSGYLESEILSFHGMGKTTIPKLKAALKMQGLRFREFRK
ncbi:MAG: RNA polymerase alpha subunit C-terminal domain-containing protein [Chitinophagales bacterium]